MQAPDVPTFGKACKYGCECALCTDVKQLAVCGAILRSKGERQHVCRSGVAVNCWQKGILMYAGQTFDKITALAMTECSQPLLAVRLCMCL